MTAEGMRVPHEWRAVRNPWTSDDELTRVLVLRGAIMWSYSYVEQRMLDLMIRCSRVTEYRDISEKPPFRRNARVGYLRKVFAAKGPLQRYASLGVAILDRYEAGAEIRNQMAHSDMSIIGGQGPVRFMEVTIKGEDITRRWTPYYAGQLERHAIEAARFSRACQRLWNAAHVREELRPIVTD